MKILLCTNTFQNITNGPTKFANFLYLNGNKNNELEVHILTEDIKEDKERLYQCKIGMMKKMVFFAPIYRMFTYYLKANQLNKIYEFDYIIYNNSIYGLIHAYFKKGIVGMINDDNNQQDRAGLRWPLNYALIKKRIFKWFEKMAIRYSGIILTNSNYLTNLLRASYPDHAEKIVRLYKGVDLNKSNFKNYSNWEVKSLRNIKILFVKNDFRRGGIKILADSLSAINLNFLITVIGPQNKDFDVIKSFFKAPNLSLAFLGVQKQAKVFELMSNHHIFCVPALQEALGVANLEALNVGIPVVSSDAGGIPEVLDYGNCGFISKAGSAESLKDCLEICLYNKELRNKKVMHGFEHVKKFRAEYIPENLKKILNGQV